MGTQLSLPQRGTAPIFAHICCGQMAACIKMSLGMEPGLGPGDFVLDGEPAAVYCGQMAEWMKTPLGTEVNLGSGHIVLDEVPPSQLPRKGHSTSLFSAYVYCGHGRPSQLLLRSCNLFWDFKNHQIFSTTLYIHLSFRQPDFSDFA